MLIDITKQGIIRAATIRPRKSKKRFINSNKEMTIDELKEYILLQK